MIITFDETVVPAKASVQAAQVKLSAVTKLEVSSAYLSPTLPPAGKLALLSSY